MAYIVWSPIYYGAEVDEASGTITKKDIADVGEEVTQGELGVDDAEWAYLLSSGAIREDEEYPVDEGRVHGRPPREILISRAKAEYEDAVAGVQPEKTEEKPKKAAEKKESGSSSTS